MKRGPLIALILIAISLLLFPLYYKYFYNASPISKAEWKHHDAEINQFDTQLHNLAHQIETSQGTGRCLRDEQCQVIGLGAQVCGLYKDYLIYSTQDANEKSLLRAVSDFNETHERLLKINLSFNDCGSELPTVRCINKECDIN
jgi:hypothetical protein